MQKNLNIPILQLFILFVFVFEYFTLFEYIRIVSVFTNRIRYSYSFQIAKRILFGIHIRSKITIRPNTDLQTDLPVVSLHNFVFEIVGLAQNHKIISSRERVRIHFHLSQVRTHPSWIHPLGISNFQADPPPSKAQSPDTLGQ